MRWMFNLVNGGLRLATLFLVFSASSAIAGAADFLRVVALSGSPAPGPPGAVFGALTPGNPGLNNYGSTPALSNSGQVSFLAEMQSGIGGVGDSNNQGIWLERGGTLELVAREGDQATGLPTGARYSSFDWMPHMNRAGQIAFNGVLAQGAGGVTTSNDRATWSDIGGSLHLVIREGDQVPGTPTGNTFKYVGVGAMNDSGQLSIRASSPVPGYGDADGIWLADSGGLIRPVLSEGDVATGLDFAAHFWLLMGSAFYRGGDAAFSASATNAPATVRKDRNGVWVNRGGSVQMVALQNRVAPGTSQDFNTFDWYPQMNSAGHVAFGATLQDGVGYQSGVWSDVGGTLQKVAAIGDQAPGLGPGVKFDLVSDPVLSDSDRLIFSGSLQQNGVSLGDALWSQKSGNIELIVRKGNPAPGTSPEDKFSSVGRIAANSAGRIAFTGSLQLGVGDVTSSNQSGIWAEDPLGQLGLILRTGDSIDVDSGPGTDLRTVASFAYFGDINSGPNGEAHQTSFNDLGQLAFVATFTDGSSGVFVSNAMAVPEPGSLAIAALLIVAGGFRRRSPRLYGL